MPRSSWATRWPINCRSSRIRRRARATLGLAPDAPVISVLPGSREGEVKRLAADFAGAVAWLAARRPGLQFVAALANGRTRSEFERSLAAEAPGVPVLVTEGRTQAALAAANVVLVASGTATLETLLCKRPMVVAYRVGRAHRIRTSAPWPPEVAVLCSAQPARGTRSRPGGRAGGCDARSDSDGKSSDGSTSPMRSRNCRSFLRPSTGSSGGAQANRRQKRFSRSPAGRLLEGWQGVAAAARRSADGGRR